MAKQFWKNLAQGFNTKRPVPGRSDGRTMKMWVFETGYYLVFALVMVLVNTGELGNRTGGAAASVILLFLGTLVGSYMTGGFGLAYLIERLVERKKKPETETPVS